MALLNKNNRSHRSAMLEEGLVANDLGESTQLNGLIT